VTLVQTVKSLKSKTSLTVNSQ